jgi:iron complex outermembrane receptor protein
VNAVKKSRNSYAAYADAEVNFTNWLLVDGAVRYEIIQILEIR